jgi:hypothetical protein
MMFSRSVGTYCARLLIIQKQRDAICFLQKHQTFLRNENANYYVSIYPQTLPTAGKFYLFRQEHFVGSNKLKQCFHVP